MSKTVKNLAELESLREDLGEGIKISSEETGEVQPPKAAKHVEAQAQQPSPQAKVVKAHTVMKTLRAVGLFVLGAVAVLVIAFFMATSAVQPAPKVPMVIMGTGDKVPQAAVVKAPNGTLLYSETTGHLWWKGYKRYEGIPGKGFAPITEKAYQWEMMPTKAKLK